MILVVVTKNYHFENDTMGMTKIRLGKDKHENHNEANAWGKRWAYFQKFSQRTWSQLEQSCQKESFPIESNQRLLWFVQDYVSQCMEVATAHVQHDEEQHDHWQTILRKRFQTTNMTDDIWVNFQISIENHNQSSPKNREQTWRNQS